MKAIRARRKKVNNWSKYNNIKTSRTLKDWSILEFDSLLEAKFYDFILENKELINLKEIKTQITFELLAWFSWNFIDIKKKKLKIKQWNRVRDYEIVEWLKKVQPIKYICDFILIMNDWTEYIIDVKWVETPDFKLKKKMFENMTWKSLLCITSVLINNWLFLNRIKNRHST